MATNRRIEIDVVLNTEQVDQGFQEIEEGSQEVTKGVGNLGESFTGLTSSISGMGDTATQRLGAVGESALGVIGSVNALGQSAQATGMSFSALLGPIGILAVAVVSVAKAWRDYQDQINGVNIRHRAYIASVSELTSALEELATYQVILNNAEVERLQNLSMLAKLDIESAQEIREDNAEIDKRVFRLTKEIEKAKERLKLNQETLRGQKSQLSSARMLEQASLAMAQAQAEIETKERIRIRLREKLSRKELQAIDLGRTGAANFAKFEAEKERLLKRSPKLRAIQLNQEAKLLEDAALNELKLREQTEESLTHIAMIEAGRRIREISAQETLSMDVRVEAIKAEEKRLALEISKIQLNAQLKREQEQAKRRARAAAFRAKKLAKEKQLESELNQIRSLEIERLRILGIDKEKILDLQLKQELKMAGDNNNKKIIAEKKHNNALTQLTIDRRSKEKQAREKADREEEQEQKRLAQQRANFIHSTLEFNAQQIEDQTTREIALLDLRYEKEIQLNKHTAKEITELQRRESIERQKILDSSFQQSMDKLKNMGQSLLQESTGAIYQSLVDAGQFDLTFEELKHDFDEKVGQAREEMLKAQASSDLDLFRQKEEEITSLTSQYESERQQIRAQQAQAVPLLFGNILKGLGQQASVEAVMELAKGFSKLGSPLTAAFAPAHFKASAIFAGVAATAGVGGAMLTNNANTSISRAGRGGGSGGTTSPTGTPQTTSIPNREEAESTSMVFNINFGGAVIYDTKQSAEQALADRITNIQNRQRRGAPRRGAM